MKTRILKLGAENIFWITAVLGFLFLFGQNAIAQETFDPAQNSSTRTVSADSFSNPKSTPALQVEPLNSEPKSLSPATREYVSPVKDDGQNLRDLWNSLDLPVDQKEIFANKLGDVANSIQKLESDSRSSDLHRALSDLAPFIEQHSETKNITETVSVFLSYVFNRLEKKSSEVKAESNQAKTNLELFGDILKQDQDAIITPLTKNLTAITSSEKNVLTPENEQERTLEVQKTMDTVLEVLRREAVNDRASALQRTMYRNCYLKLAKKVRFNHLQYVRLLSEQKRAEEFKLPSSYQ